MFYRLRTVCASVVNCYMIGYLIVGWTNKEIKGECCPNFESVWLLWGCDLGFGFRQGNDMWWMVPEPRRWVIPKLFQSYFWTFSCIIYSIAYHACLHVSSWHDLASMSSWGVLCRTPTSPPLLTVHLEHQRAPSYCLTLNDLFERWVFKCNDLTGSREQ